MPNALVVPKFTWQTIILKLPAGSRYFKHDDCPGGCMRAASRPTQLSAATIAHVAMVIADRVRESDPDSRAYLSVRGLAAAAKRNPHTVMLAIGHLRAVGLLDRARRGGDLGVAKKAPSIYCLTIPDAGLLRLAELDPAAIARAAEQLAAGPRESYEWWRKAT